jgi:MGT family glycosyltransferase
MIERRNAGDGTPAMATLLLYTSPALGNLFPMLALAQELHSRGHRVVVRTLTAGIATARGLNLETEAIDRRIEAIEMTDWQEPNPRAALAAAFAVFTRRAPLEVDDLRGAIRSVAPDALILDANCWGATAAADAGDLPWLTFWPFTPLLSSRGAPPYGPGLRPWPGLLGRVRDSALRPLITGAVEDALMGPLRETRRLAGAADVESVDELIRRAPLALVATAEPFEYPHPDWGEAIALIGPCDFDSQVTTPPWLDEIDRPLILVTTSSDRQADERLPAVAMSALGALDVHLVVTCPCGVPADISVPCNATVGTFIPHGPLLERAVCAVTHGGMGVTQKALIRGVPVCVVPFGRDQFEVSRRVVVARCGTRLPAHRLTGSRLKDRVVRAMTMSAGAREVAAGFAASGGVTRGADLIERRLLAPAG